MENSSDFYYEKLRNAEKPGTILASFYCRIYNIEVTKSEIMLFNKLLRTFSRFIIFYSILDTAGSKPERIESPYPYLFEICKRRFENAHLGSTIQSREPLEKRIAHIDEELEKIKTLRKKIIIPSSEGLSNG